MRIRDITISPSVIEKILYKHGIRPSEIKQVLQQTHAKTYFEKIKGTRYLAIGKSLRGYITIFFDYKYGIAEVATARFSNDSEKRRYRRRIGKG